MLRLIKLTTSIGTAETIVVPEDPRIMEITQVLMDELELIEDENWKETMINPLLQTKSKLFKQQFMFNQINNKYCSRWKTHGISSTYSMFNGFMFLEY